jgi:oxygen-independent coproporphyrinogen-3 oxidase
MMEEKQTILGFGVGAGSKVLNLLHGGIDNVYNPKDLLLYLSRLDEIIAKKVDKLKGIVYNNF